MCIIVATVAVCTNTTDLWCNDRYSERGFIPVVTVTQPAGYIWINNDADANWLILAPLKGYYCH